MWFAASAFGSVFDVDYGRVVDPASNPLTANGIGSPTIAWDPDDELYVVFFETQVDTATTAPCGNGKWGIGAASSTDGVTFTIWDDLIVAPTDGTPWACVAAHPTVVYEGGTFHLWFKAEDGSMLPRSPAAAWDADNYTGVGYATVDVQLDDKTDEIAAIDAQIAGLISARDAAVLDYRDDLQAYENHLLAQADEFACASTSSPICAPCSGTSFSFNAAAGATQPRNKTFCQDVRFNVPSNVSLTLPGGYIGYATSVLTWDSGSCTRQRFGYWFGTTSSYSCTVAPGTNVATRNVSLVLTNIGFSTVSTNYTLNATNVASQTTTGLILSDLDTLIALASVPSWQQVSNRLTSWINRLNTMNTWLTTAPVTADESSLSTNTISVRSGAQALQTLFTNTPIQIADLEADRDALEAYVQGVDATLSSSLALPLASRFGYPSAVKLDGDWVLFLQQYPDLVRASGAQPDALTLDGVTVVEAGTVSWANTEVYESSFVCDDGAYPYTAWVGGKSVVAGVMQSAGFADAISDDGFDWLLNLEDTLWTDTNAFRHFDVIGDDAGELRMYHVERVGGRNEIHLQATDAGFSVDDTRQRVCEP